MGVVAGNISGIPTSGAEAVLGPQPSPGGGRAPIFGRRATRNGETRLWDDADRAASDRKTEGSIHDKAETVLGLRSRRLSFVR